MKSQDEAYPFSVDRNFYYLTGIERENMILVLKKSHTGQYSEALYIEPYDEVLAKWVGARMRNAEATEISGVEQVFSVEDFDAHLVHRYPAYISWDRVHPNWVGSMIIARKIMKAIGAKELY